MGEEKMDQGLKTRSREFDGFRKGGLASITVLESFRLEIGAHHTSLKARGEHSSLKLCGERVVAD